MDSALPSFRPEDLLAHRDFVRGLSISLLRDPERAADAEQETWLRAIESPPRHGGNLRAWLAAVLRNVVRQGHRSATRRVAREHQAARPDGVVPAGEVAAREEIRQRVIDAVQALDEPYRSAVLWRHYHDLPPREIAARLDVPVETVKTRIKRGLALLRERLDASHGGNRKVWGAALVLLFTAPGADAALPGAVATVGSRPAALALGAALLLPALGVAAWVGWGGGQSGSAALPLDGTPEAGASATPEAPAQPGASAATNPTGEAAGRTAATPGAVASVPIRPLAAEDGTGAPGWGGLRVTVVDAGGRPVPGAMVGLGLAHAEPPPEGFASHAHTDVGNSDHAWVKPVAVPVATDAEGVARLRVEFGGTSDAYHDDLWVGAPGHAVTRVGQMRVVAGRERDGGTIRLPQGCELRGTVRGPDGRPIAGARVRTKPVYREGTPWTTEAPAWIPAPAATSGPDGTFTLRAVRLGEVIVVAERSGFALAEEHLETPRAEALLLTLAAGHGVEGRVVGATGHPPLWVHAEGAARRVAVSADGRFRVPDLPAKQLGFWLVDGIGRDWGSAFRRVGTETAPFEIRARPPGTPDPGLADEFDDEDEDDEDDYVQRPLKGTVRDDTTGAPITRFTVSIVSVTGSGEDRFQEVWSTEQVDAQGRFTTADLEAGTHTVRVRARGYAPAVQQVVIEAKNALETLAVRLRRGGLALSGVVVRATDGQPVAGVRVAVGRLRGTIGSGDPEDVEAERSALYSPAFTDARGRFTLRFLADEPIALLVDGADVGVARTTVHSIHPRSRAVTVKVEQVFSISGRVLRGDGSTPGAGLQIHCTPRDHDPDGGVGSATWTHADAQGRFQLTGLPPGTYRLDAAEHSEWPLLVGHDVVVPPNVQGLELRCPTPGTLVLHADLPRGAISGGIRLAPAGRFASLGKYLEEGNRLRVAGLGPGRWRLILDGGNFYDVETEFDILAGKESQVVLQLPPGELRLRLRTPGDAPFTGPVTVTQHTGARLSSRTMRPDGEGRLTVFGVGTARYGVTDAMRERGPGRTVWLATTGAAHTHTVVVPGGE